MKETESPVMLDSNMLVYAFDMTEGFKHRVASELFENFLGGNLKAALSPQVLSEFFVTITGERKKTGVNIPLSVDEASNIVMQLASASGFIILDLKASDVLTAITLKKMSKASYWDCLIAATMKENGIRTIYTEDSSFEKIEGIKAVNPFTQPT